MWTVLLRRIQFASSSSELGGKNAEFYNRVKGHQKKFNLHEKTRDIKQQDIDKWASEHSKKELNEKIVK